jgi:hypothetical protein
VEALADEVKDKRGAVNLALGADCFDLIEQAVGHAHRDEGDALADFGRRKIQAGGGGSGRGLLGLTVAGFGEPRN